ncbi:MAG: S41 family peptidase [Clostridia bacterium]|nr:S41 family peptidase [Clostridia bacterium]
MKKKISVSTMISILILVVVLTVAITMGSSVGIYNKLIENLPDRTGMYKQVANIDELVRKKYYKPIDGRLLSEGLSAGYVSGLEDPSSFYLSAEDYIIYKNRLDGKVAGTGLTCKYNKEKNVLSIIGVAENSSAANAGLKLGDEIIKVGEDEVNEKNSSNLIKKLYGEKLTSVDVTYKRDGKTISVNLVMGFSLNTVNVRMIGDIAYIHINAFYGNTRDQLDETLKNIKKQKATAIILDLRNTSEGNIENAASALDLIVPVGSSGTKAIAIAKDRDGKVIKTFPSDAEQITLPILCLVSQTTKGPAELFACDLKEFGKAELIGETTAGVGTMQDVFSFSDGSAVVLSVANIYPLSGISYDKTGLNPDYPIPLTEKQRENLGLMKDSEDPHIVKALEILSKGE